MPDGSGWKGRRAALLSDRMRMDRRAWAATNLAAALLAAPWTSQSIAAAVETGLGPSQSRRRAGLIEWLLALGTPYPPAPDRLAALLYDSRRFGPARGRRGAVLDPPLFAPAPAFVGLDLPQLATLGALADWLELSVEALDWLSDERRSLATAGDTLQHYRYAFLAKRDGTERLIEAPKPRLKRIQRRILDEILAKMPVHESAQGFVAGRSCLGHAQRHAGEAMVLTLDLAQFFPSLGVARIHGLFRLLGYPWAVARRLTGLCSTTTPLALARRLPAAEQRHYAAPHLPQGAPSSPALANLAAWPLDRRLAGLARAAGANYSRYADDLAFSGDARPLAGFERKIALIVAEEGFALNPLKTRRMRRSERQQVTGIVVNAHNNLGRAEFDRLKAILHNCRIQGAAGQNRGDIPDFRRHLDGRVSWVEQVNPQRGAKLRRLFDLIGFDATDRA
jgi:RNA-directed DNA polymerase